VMGANFALEQALWFAPPGVAGVETPTYRRSEAFPIVRAECRAVRSAVGLYETTNYGKYEVTGRGARAWLDRVFASRIPRPGRFALAPMLNPAGRIVGDLSIACLADDRFLIVGSGFAEEFHLRWFSASDPPPDVFLRSALDGPVASRRPGDAGARPPKCEKAYGSFNKDFRPDHTPGETGLDRFVDFSKSEFTGRSAALAERAVGAKRRFVVMEVAEAEAEVVGYESIMKEGAAVGYVTSGA